MRSPIQRPDEANNNAAWGHVFVGNGANTTDLQARPSLSQSQDLSISAARPGDHAPNQVWAMDITYIPMSRGFVYLAVVLDWFSRRLLA
jgi:transposase InsO family protein